MRKNVLFLLSCISGAAIQLLATTVPAEAAIRVVPGQRCSVDKQSYNLVYVHAKGIENGSTSSSLIYTTCGLPIDSDLPPSSISYLEVNGYDGKNNASVSAYACVTYYDQSGGYCYNGVSSGSFFTGMYFLTPPLNALHLYPWDYAHIFVLFPGGNSSVTGVWYQ
jgi:hypothetical protein